MLRRSILISVLAVCANAFTAPTPAGRSTRSTELFLKPSEGSQLAAAWEASCHGPQSESKGAPPLVITTTPVSAARAFVSRVFSLPSSILHPNEIKDDVVYYPIVGFKLVPDGEGHSSVLPTTARVSCRIPAAQTELLFGWYSPACFVDVDEEWKSFDWIGCRLKSAVKAIFYMVLFCIDLETAKVAMYTITL